MNRAARSFLSWSLLAVSGGLFLPAAAIAQTRVSGRVVDPEGKPMPGIEVLLHSITETGGTELDKDTSRTDGAFDVVTAVVDPNAVYFVTVVHEQQLYMGDMLRAPFPAGQEYIVRVGVNPVDLSPAAAAAAVPPQAVERDRTAGIIVIIVSAGVILGVLFLIMRRRPPAHRRWLVELARIEDELASNPNADEAVTNRRRELRERLIGRASD